MKKARQLTVLVAIVLVSLAAASASATEGVSPGAGDRLAVIRDGCPTFSWGAVDGAAFYELVAYQLPEGEGFAALAGVVLSQTEEVLYTRVVGKATGWTPELEKCFVAGGSYVWFVRAVFDEKAAPAASEWSQGLYFSVASAPSAEELREALGVIQRYLDDGGGGAVELAALISGTDADADAGAARRLRSTGTNKLVRRVLPGTAAIRGEQPDPSGETYGVVGQVQSIDGTAGVFENTSGGQILSGWSNVLEVFSVEGDGHVVAEGFVGDGSALTQVDADMLDGMDSTEFGDIQSVTAGSGLTGGGTNGDVTLLINAGAINGDHLAANSVGPSEIAPGAVAGGAGGDLLDGTITSADIADGTITGFDIASYSIFGSNIINQTLSSLQIADSSIYGSKIAPNHITGVHLADDSVYSQHITAGAVGSSAIASGAVGIDQLRTIRAVRVECNSECTDGSLADICGSGYYPFAVSCVDVSDTGSTPCGGDNLCSRFTMYDYYHLSQFCEDQSGFDAVVFCLAD